MEDSQRDSPGLSRNVAGEKDRRAKPESEAAIRLARALLEGRELNGPDWIVDPNDLRALRHADEENPRYGALRTITFLSLASAHLSLGQV